MSLPQRPPAAKLIIGAILADKDRFCRVIDDMIALFGTVDIVSPWYAFDYTDYYHQEMGQPLFRRVAAFKRHIGQIDLPLIKCRTNRLEQRYAAHGQRTVNLDPGYLLKERLVLASGKNFAHRIYLDKGIYADLTLIYEQGAFKTLPWTYPDYAAPVLLDWLAGVRAKYRFDTKATIFG